MEIRLNKMLSDAGLCSRREADEYIKEGRVRVNDDLPRVGQKVTENDKVTFDDIIVNISKQSIRKANSEAATKPKLSDNKKKEIISSEIK
ncbi:MAG: S4 domain-containing protein, partial [Parabacteroides sp.]|nr:S4 domain-containing protein [Parabacteroides sp.]